MWISSAQTEYDEILDGLECELKKYKRRKIDKRQFQQNVKLLLNKENNYQNNVKKGLREFLQEREMYYILRILQITFSDSWKVIQVAVQKVIQLAVRKRQSAIQFAVQMSYG